MKHDVTYTRPFNFKHAKDGAPISCRNGDKVFLYNMCSNNPKYPLLGEIIRSGWPLSWSKNGKTHVGDKEYDTDLVMLPLGFCEKSPVFTDDVLYLNESSEAVKINHYFCANKISMLFWKPFNIVKENNFYTFFQNFYENSKIHNSMNDEDCDRVVKLSEKVEKHTAYSIWKAAILSVRNNS
jgi:hypothetical protein